MATEPEVTIATSQPDTPNTTQPEAVEPIKHQHSSRLLNVCRELGITPAQAETMDDAALRREIQDAQLEHQIRASRQPRQVQQQTQTQTETEPEEGFDLPVELRTKLAGLDLDPALIEALNHIGKEAVKGRKTARQLEQLRQEQANRDLRTQVHSVLDTMPATGGSKASRNRAIERELGDLEQSGQLQGLSVQEAVQVAYQNLYGSTEPAPKQPPRPTPKPATPTARPTNRLAPSLQGQLDNLNGNTPDDFIP